TVRQLENAIALRAHECLDSVEDLFLENPPFRKFRIATDSPEGADVREVLGDVWKELQGEEVRRRRLETLHQQRAAPLPAVAQKLGKSVFDTVRHFAVSDDLAVHCTLGHPDELMDALAALAPGTELVLDSTSVATLYLL